MTGTRGTLAAVAAAVLAMMLALPLGAGARDGVNTSVSSFSWTDNDDGTDFFDGAVSSAQPKCVKDRRVTLYRQAAGSDLRIKGVTTDRDGEFVVERENPGSGRYYLRVKRKRAAGVSCKRAVAGPLQITDLSGV